MPLPPKGNPQTFKKGTMVITPWMIDGQIVANGTPANMVISSGEWSNDGAAAEAETNTYGRLVVSGNQKVEISVTGYISQGDTNLTTPLAPGQTWELKQGDYAAVLINAGSFSAGGVFMISQETTSLDPNEVMNLDLTLMSHGDVDVNTKKIVAGA